MITMLQMITIATVQMITIKQCLLEAGQFVLLCAYIHTCSFDFMEEQCNPASIAYSLKFFNIWIFI